ncbi:TonB-dependent receptor, partial [hydrothermal vent metagenome]
MKTSHIAVRAAMLSAAVYSVALPSIGFAQEQQNDEALDESDSVLGEIVVTAQRREQSIQDVGIAITALTGDQLSKQGIDNIDGLANSVPNFQLFNLSGGGVPVVILRGVGLQNFRINDTPTTGIYVDDVYQVNIAQVEATLFDMERIEVLKGPQGGLYGRNAVGGAIQYISRKPSFDAMEGYVSLSYGRFNTFTAEGAVSGPVSDNFALRVAGRVVTSGDTYFRSTTGGFDHGEQERWAGRVLASWRPTETTTLDFKVHAGQDNSETALFRTIGAYEPNIDAPFLPGTTLSRFLGLAGYCASILAGGPREPGRCTVTGGETPASFGVVGRYDSASTSRPGLDTDWW